jgi:hypothetical protein
MDGKVVRFQYNFSRRLVVARLFRRVAVNRTSSSRNVNFANGKTDRILVPYKVGCCVASKEQLMLVNGSFLFGIYIRIGNKN